MFDFHCAQTFFSQTEAQGDTDQLSLMALEVLRASRANRDWVKVVLMLVSPSTKAPQSSGVWVRGSELMLRARTEMEQNSCSGMSWDHGIVEWFGLEGP